VLSLQSYSPDSLPPFSFECSKTTSLGTLATLTSRSRTTERKAAGSSSTATCSDHRQTRCCSQACWAAACSCFVLLSDCSYLLVGALAFPAHDSVARVCLCLTLHSAVLGVFYHTNRGALFVAALIVFSFTSCVSGYVANSWYQKLAGTNWTRCTLATYFMFIGPFFVVATLLNFVAISKNSSVALPFGTICVILLILLLVSLPLCVLGGIAGKNYGSPLNPPCRTNKIPRQIPDLPWYRHSFVQSIMAGFLPFSAIYIEISELFAAGNFCCSAVICCLRRLPPPTLLQFGDLINLTRSTAYSASSLSSCSSSHPSSQLL
jgi:hypothetical protein